MDTPRPLWSAAAEPWRNGGGITRQLAARDGNWRVSLAHIEQDGPYSRFEGMLRTSIVVCGEGVTLRYQDTTVELSPFLPASYDGDQEWIARLHKGAVKALNVMVRKSKYQATIHPVPEHVVVPPGSTAVVVALERAASYAIDGTAVRGVVRPGFWITLSDFSRPLQIAPVITEGEVSMRNTIILVNIETIRKEHSN
ncbi:HutD family protein [Paraburkholderia phytofirmans]